MTIRPGAHDVNRPAGTGERIGFDRAVRDAADPTRILPKYDSGGRLHLNDAGHRAMADAVPIGLLYRTGR